MLFGCTLGPDYERPDTLAGLSDSYHYSVDHGSDHPPPYLAEGWWSSIEDPLLNEWIDQLLKQNLNLGALAERIIQAEEQMIINGASLWPHLKVDGGASRNFFTTSPEHQKIYASDLNAGLNLSWQIDLFGKLRQARASANYSVLATGENYRALQHTLIAELVKRRADIDLLHQELNIQTIIITSRTLTLETITRRYRLGARGITAVDVFTAEENVATAQAKLTSLKQELHLLSLAVDALLSLAPGSTLKAMGPFQPHSSPQSFPKLSDLAAPSPGLPAAILDQRPDIRGHEFQIMAANANIGVAITDLLPEFTLSANRGFVHDQFSGLLNNNNAVGTLTALLNLRLFEGGRLKAGVRLRESQARESALLYAETVLQAFIEVETALVEERLLKEQIQHLERSVTSARRAETLAQQRYHTGITALLQLLDTQRRRQSAEQSLLNARRAAWHTRINLHLALGGDWIKETEKLPKPITENSVNSRVKNESNH